MKRHCFNFLLCVFAVGFPFLAVPQAIAADEACSIRVFVGAFPTDHCPWDDEAFRGAMRIVEAARWRCPRLDTYAEEQFIRMSEAAGIKTGEAELSQMLGRDCADPRTIAAFATSLRQTQ